MEDLFEVVFIFIESDDFNLKLRSLEISGCIGLIFEEILATTKVESMILLPSRMILE